MNSEKKKSENLLSFIIFDDNLIEGLELVMVLVSWQPRLEQAKWVPNMSIIKWMWIPKSHLL